LLVALDHFDIVAEHLFGPFDQCARVTTIHKYLDDCIEVAEKPHQHRPRPHPILHPGRMHHRRQHIALRVDRDVPLAPFDLFACIVTLPLPFKAVFVDCESMIATVGVGLRPLALRPCSLKDLVTRSQVPRKRQARSC